METVLLQDWKFSLNAGDEAWQPDADDSQWEDVVVPHDWSVTLPFSTVNSSGTGYLPGGTGWYRAVFTVPAGWNGRADWAGKQAFVHFDGAYKNSRVWCNGYYLGCRPSGYTGFRYDIAHCLREGHNVIAVKVSHEDIADSRWFTGSGMYRKAYLRFYDSVYIDDATLFVRGECRGDEAAITVSGELCGEFATALADGLQVRAVLNDKDGKCYEGVIAVKAAAATPTTLPPGNGETLPFEITVKVAEPELWSPEQPNLYTLTVAIVMGNKTLSVTPPLRTGIRGIAFDPDKGFFLNGKSMKIKGVCVHHDAGCLGAAVWPDVWRRRLEKLKAAGCNAIRMSHNPHMPELYDLCDEMGFLVMDEAFDEWEGCKNKWWQGHNVYPPKHQGYAENFPQWHERDLADMVLRGRNHPGIIMWSIGNEIDYPNDPYVHPRFQEMTGNNDANKPAAERQYNTNKPNMERLSVIAARLVKIVKKYDTTRPVLTAAAFPELSSRLGFLDALDIAGYNYKEQFYDEDHKRFPKLPIIGSENSHSVSAWKAVRDNDFISGQFLWTGIDYLGEAHGWPIRCSGAGLLNTAGFEKIAWFRRKALWDAAPFLYLTSRPAGEQGREIHPWQLYRSWDYLPGEDIEVICYTNLAQAELFCNGKSLGKESRSDDFGYIRWTIPFERGELSVRGEGAGGGASNGAAKGNASDSLESTLPPVLLRLSEWKPAGNVPAQVQGKYRVAQIEASLLDEKNRLCVRGDSTVNVSLSGPACFLGMENGDIADCTEYQSKRRNLYQGRLIIYALIDTAANAPCVLTATAAGLKPAIITIS